MVLELSLHLYIKQEQGLGDSHKMVEAPNFFLPLFMLYAVRETLRRGGLRPLIFFEQNSRSEFPEFTEFPESCVQRSQSAESILVLNSGFSQMLTVLSPTIFSDKLHFSICLQSYPDVHNPSLSVSVDLHGTDLPTRMF